ncbi:MAG TPA: F0F1 ATP synthase subunit A, partial [Ottowia sp.]|nr:F0F1 ATP synthase subunit A [Ottowia sp.]
MAADAAQGQTAGEYIQHHLHHLQKNFAFENVTQKSIIDFSLFNADSVFWSVLLGALGCWLLWLGARKATSGVPGRFQAAVEILSEMVENQAKGVIHNAKSRKL